MFFKLEENNTANSKEKVLLQKEESSLDCTEMSNEVSYATFLHLKTTNLYKNNSCSP